MKQNESFAYDAFISYSHAADGRLAPALETALQRFGIPWWKKRSLTIFRDESSLSVSPKLWDNITQALDKSKYLIFMASPLSAQSKWVNMEIEYWIQHKSIETILIVLTDGEIKWDDEKGKAADHDLNALTPALVKHLKAEPFYVDLRDLNNREQVTTKNPIFYKEVLKLAAQLHNKQPKDLASDELRAQRNWKRIRTAAFIVLFTLLTVSILKTIQANRQRKIALEKTKVALSNNLIATSSFFNASNSTQAFRMAEYALKLNQNSSVAYGALLRAFYSQPHFFNDALHPNVFYKAPSEQWPSTNEENNEYSTAEYFGFEPRRFNMQNIQFSPDEQHMLFYSPPYGTKMTWDIELWNTDTLMNSEDRIPDAESNRGFQQAVFRQPEYKQAIYQQVSTSEQTERFNSFNFSYDSRYVAIPKANGTQVIDLYPPNENDGNMELFQLNRSTFFVEHSNTQMLQAGFPFSNHLLYTINEDNDTTTFDLEKMPLITLDLSAHFYDKQLFSDEEGNYIIVVTENEGAEIWNLKGENLGEVVVNANRTRLQQAPSSIKNWENIQLQKIFDFDRSQEYSLFASSSDERYSIDQRTVTDSLSNKTMILNGHSEQITSVDIADNGQLILTSTCPVETNRETKLWDAEGNELLRITGFGGLVGFLPGAKAFFTFNNYCYTDWGDLTFVVWPIDADFLSSWVNENKIHQLSALERNDLGIDSLLLSQ